MKSHELIYALMHRQGLGSLTLAKKLKNPGLQAPIYRFVRGQSTPEAETARQIAKYFDLPLEALYDDQVATKTAAARDLTVVPVAPPKPRVRANEANRAAEVIAKKYDSLTPERKRLIDLIMNSPGPEELEPSPKELEMLRRIEEDYDKTVRNGGSGHTGNSVSGDLDDAGVVRLPGTGHKAARASSGKVADLADANARSKPTNSKTKKVK
jgi:DNA-binding XRE family transcriptional regulator